MEKLDEQIKKLRCNASFDVLITLTRCLYKGFPLNRLEKTKEIVKKACKEDDQPWQKYIVEEHDKTLNEIFGELFKEPQIELYLDILSYLNSFSYTFAPLIPLIGPEKAMNLSMGHPLCFWLYDYVDTLEAIIIVAICLNPNKDLVPNSILRIYELTQRFRHFVHPLMISYNDKLVKDSEEFYPEFNKILKN